MAVPTRRKLDKDYVSDIVGLPVKSFTIADGSKKGDNVIGKMLSLTVETEAEEEASEGRSLHVVVKSLIPLTSDAAADPGESYLYVAQLKVFPSEMTYYKEVRPLLKQVTGYPLNSPVFYSGITDDFNDYIALEDMRFKGYKMADKKKGLSLVEVTETLKRIAVLHAHSYSVISSGNNSKIKELQKSVLKEHIWSRKVFDIAEDLFFNLLIQKMTEVIRETGSGSVAARMERFSKIGHNIIIDLFSKTGTTPKYFPVIIHGDFWVNNVLFKYSSDGTIEDITFIDFQQCRFSNIYEELQYFFFTSTTPEFRKNHLRTCLKAYHSEFSRILKEDLNNFPLPSGFSDEELIATFYENIEYGFCYSLVAIPFQLNEPPQEQSEQLPLPPPIKDNQEPPSVLALQMMLGMAEGLKQGTKNSPVALHRLHDIVSEMIKLNVLY